MEVTFEWILSITSGGRTMDVSTPICVARCSITLRRVKGFKKHRTVCIPGMSFENKCLKVEKNGTIFGKLFKNSRNTINGTPLAAPACFSMITEMNLRQASKLNALAHLKPNANKLAETSIPKICSLDGFTLATPFGLQAAATSSGDTTYTRTRPFESTHRSVVPSAPFSQTSFCMPLIRTGNDMTSRSLATVQRHMQSSSLVSKNEPMKAAASVSAASIAHPTASFLKSFSMNFNKRVSTTFSLDDKSSMHTFNANLINTIDCKGWSKRRGFNW